MNKLSKLLLLPFLFYSVHEILAQNILIGKDFKSIENYYKSKSIDFEIEQEVGNFYLVIDKPDASVLKAI